MHFLDLGPSASVSWVIHKGTDLVWPVFCALPRSKQLRQPGAWQEPFPQVGIVSYHLHGPSPSISWVCSRHAFSVVACVSSGELISGWAPRRMSTVQNPKKSKLATEPACSLVEDVSLGPSLPLSGFDCPRPACLQWGMGWSAAG